MSTDTEAQRISAVEKAAKKTLRKVQAVNVPELEKRVQIAELRAREVEAEVRYLVATQQRRDMRAGKRDRSQEEREQERLAKKAVKGNKGKNRNKDAD